MNTRFGWLGVTAVCLMWVAAVPAGGSVEGAVSPSLTVGLNAAYVASPEGEVLEIDLQRFAVARHLAVGGTPLSIAVAGNVRA